MQMARDNNLALFSNLLRTMPFCILRSAKYPCPLPEELKCEQPRRILVDRESCSGRQRLDKGILKAPHQYWSIFAVLGFYKICYFAVIVNNPCIPSIGQTWETYLISFCKIQEKVVCERTAAEVSFEWLLRGFLYKDLKVRIGLFKKYHNTFCCHFLLQTFAQVLFSILSQEKLNTMLMQN